MTLRQTPICLQEQETTRMNFREGHTDVLLATDVGAEGMDFRQCSLVIAFDPPKVRTWLTQPG